MHNVWLLISCNILLARFKTWILVRNSFLQLIALKRHCRAHKMRSPFSCTTCDYNLTLWWYSCPALSSPDVNLNHLSQATHKNPVCSLIQDYFAIWLCGDNSCPAISSPAVKMNLLSQATHMNLVCSLIQNYFAIWLCSDNPYPAMSSLDVLVLLSPELGIGIGIDIENKKVLVSLSPELGIGIGIVKQPRVGYWYRYWYRK